MLKAADALDEAGYEVRVVSTRISGWTMAADAAIAASRRWTWRSINYDRTDATATWLWSGARHKAARAVANLVTSVPPSVATLAFARVHRELVDAILETPCDVIYGGTTGAIAAAAEAGRRAGIPFAIDFEDYHSAEHEPSAEGDLSNALASRVMQWSSTDAAFVTAGSAAIADACRRDLGIAILPINNVFPLPSVVPRPRERDAGEPFAAYWFSQTISGGRGLEDVVRAFGLTGIAATLTLRGCAIPGYLETLYAFAGDVAPQLEIRVVGPTPPDSMVDACRAFDLGIAAEQGPVRNHLLALSNKALTYPLAGVPVALTDTPGQRPLAMTLGEGGIVFVPGDAAALAEQLGSLMTDPAKLARARAASWEAARTRWHWQHELERGALLDAIAKVAA